jgi:hypothetical protein
MTIGSEPCWSRPKQRAGLVLEALDPETLRARLGLAADQDGAPAIAPVAQAVRTCVRNWRSPARQRVSAYLHRQLAAAGYDEQAARDRVRDIIDALIDIGDLTAVRLNGTASLVLSRGSAIRIGAAELVVLGTIESDGSADLAPWRYARGTYGGALAESAMSFADWLGPADFRMHLARRGGGPSHGTMAEYWATLVSALRHEGNPIDRSQVRAVIGPPSADRIYFGRHLVPDGRWSSDVPPGTWCAVRPGRNPNEWHPILIEASDAAVIALDLFDWDEWNWALLARGMVAGASERSDWRDGVLAFEHPIPRQFLRALRLLGGPAERAWTWRLSEVAFQCFDDWRRSEL